MRDLIGILACLLFVSPFVSAQAEDRPPNIVLIFADDQGYNDIACFGSPQINTPHLDELAQQGTRFTDFYVSASVCSASRAALLTGTYNDRIDVPGVFFPNRKYEGLNPEEVTIAEVLKTKGYATACFGKWHLGDEPAFLPTRQGFDTYFGIPYSNDMKVNWTMAVHDDVTWREGMTLEKMRDQKNAKRNWVPILRDEAVVEYPADQRTLTKRYTEHAVKFMQANKDKPFFLYLPHTMPHVPLFVSEKFSDGNKQRGLYGDVIEEMDHSVGTIVAAIKNLGLADNTIVIFTSDNGPWLSYGKKGGSAEPLRDGKFSIYEGGMRVPMIAWGPGHVAKGKTNREIAATIDLLPTFADYAGAKVPGDRVIDGRSIRDLLANKEGAASPHSAYFFRTDGVRQGKWKLTLNNRSTVKAQPKGKFPALYDLEADISETNNLASEHPEIVKRLTELIENHRASLKETLRPRGKAEPRELTP